MLYNPNHTSTQAACLQVSILGQGHQDPSRDFTFTNPHVGEKMSEVWSFSRPATALPPTCIYTIECLTLWRNLMYQVRQLILNPAAKDKLPSMPMIYVGRSYDGPVETVGPIKSAAAATVVSGGKLGGGERRTQRGTWHKRDEARRDLAVAGAEREPAKDPAARRLRNEVVVRGAGVLHCARAHRHAKCAASHAATAAGGSVPVPWRVATGALPPHCHPLLIR